MEGFPVQALDHNLIGTLQLAIEQVREEPHRLTVHCFEYVF